MKSASALIESAAKIIVTAKFGSARRFSKKNKKKQIHFSPLSMVGAGRGEEEMAVGLFRLYLVDSTPISLPKTLPNCALRFAYSRT